MRGLGAVHGPVVLEGGDHDHHEVGIDLAVNLLHKVPAVHIGHPQIGDHELEGPLLQEGEGLQRTRRGRDLVVVLQYLIEVVPEDGVILDDQDCAFHV